MKKLFAFLLFLAFCGFIMPETPVRADAKASMTAAGDFSTIPGIIAYLDETIPGVTDSNLTLPTILGSARLTWTSSDPATISPSGVVSRNRVDTSVALSCKIKLKGKTGTFDKTVLVLKYDLKLLTDKKLTFTYLYDSAGFQGFRTGDLDKIDVINYAFAGINNNQLVFTLPNYQTVIPAAHEKGVWVVLAIGGWGADGFSNAALTPSSRQTFVTSVMSAISKYKLDGIDLDWEYPTSTAGGQITGRPEDKHNFTLLLADLRQAMDQYDPDLILSAAVPAGTWAVNTCYEPALINQYLDYLHIMSYDLIDYATYITMHHTNLYSSPYNPISANTGILAYSAAGIDISKMALGIAFYGHLYVTTEPGDNGIGAASVASQKATITYSRIASDYLSNSAYTFYWDDTAKAGWLYGNNVFISYDEPQSIAEKCTYAINNNLAGVMVWQYAQDDASSTLLNAIYANINPS